MIRLARIEDLNEIMEIVKDAKAFLKSQGVDQWQGDYPTSEVFVKDISNNNLYVYEEEIIKGFIAIIKGIDVTYNKIYEGTWLSDSEYVTIHRIAVKKDARNKNIATSLIDYTERLATKDNIKSIRIDTHKDNIPMQNMITKNGFIKCGIIYLLDGNPRLAYEKLLK